ncbi:uncharacterized protein LOC124159864 [Ischnura elegans]|uniref:uncharacterized protein LOC124159864 n=1 Tax=Ischnura elegans TaxID=197161 RepID=UPI001ED8948B|nr:uncharacterized protein LOC124159864 [Ischnura elegans]
MENKEPTVCGDKENLVANVRDKIENWREQRYEKYRARLLRVRDSGGNKNHFVSPLILGMKCPKSVIEKVTHQDFQDQRERKALGELQPDHRCRKSGTRHSRKFPVGPPVRQTITSKLRILQSNPLLEGNSAKRRETIDLNITADSRRDNVKEVESPEAMFSTPAIGNCHLQFPDSISIIKHDKPSVKISHSKTFLKYD